MSPDPQGTITRTLPKHTVTFMLSAVFNFLSLQLSHTLHEVPADRLNLFPKAHFQFMFCQYFAHLLVLKLTNLLVLEWSVLRSTKNK